MCRAFTYIFILTSERLLVCHIGQVGYIRAKKKCHLRSLSLLCQKRDWRCPAHQSCFWYDNDKDLNRCVFLACDSNASDNICNQRNKLQAPDLRELQQYRSDICKSLDYVTSVDLWSNIIAMEWPFPHICRTDLPSFALRSRQALIVINAWSRLHGFLGNLSTVSFCLFSIEKELIISNRCVEMVTPWQLCRATGPLLREITLGKH